MKQAQEPGDGARPEDVAAALAGVDQALAALAPGLAPEAVPGHRVAAVVAGLSAIERRARGLRLVLRKAQAETGAWKAAGARSAAEHVAKQEGISVGQARAELAASERLARLPEAREATAAGELSVEKAKAVAEGAAADPAAEKALVAAAREGDLRDAQDAARRAVARADDQGDGGRAMEVYRRRSLKTWLSVDGEGHGVWNIPAESHHRFLAALEPYRRQAFRDARANGVRLSDEALMADALDMLARDVLLDHQTDHDHDHGDVGPVGSGDPGVGGAGRSGCDAGRDGSVASLFDDDPGPVPTRDSGTGGGDRGPVGDPGAGGPGATAADDAAGSPGPPGARPRPAGAGPEPPARRSNPPPRPTAPPSRRRRRAPAQVMVLIDYQALLRGHALDGEACEVTGLGPVPVSLVQHMMNDALLRLVFAGDDVAVVSTHRRYIPAHLRAAVWARDQGTCIVPGCHATRGLEVDHRHDFAKGGPTALDNLGLLCRAHHTLKTLGGWRLHGNHQTGWTFTPPRSSAPGPGDEPP